MLQASVLAIFWLSDAIAANLCSNPWYGTVSNALLNSSAAASTLLQSPIEEAMSWIIVANCTQRRS